MYDIICEICGKHIESNFSHTKTCSTECKKKRYNKIYGRDVDIKLPPNTMGSVAEMKVAVYFMLNGYDVFRALSLTATCDLIAIKGDRVLKIEVKSGYKSPKTGNISCPASDKSRYDVLAVYVLAEDDVFIKVGKNIVNDLNNPFDKTNPSKH